MTLEELKKIKPIETEKEYWEAHEVFKKTISRHTRKVKSYLGNPMNYINEFEAILKEGVRIKVITKEYAQEQRQRIYNELNKPSEFKEWVGNKLNNAKKKIKFK